MGMANSTGIDEQGNTAQNRAVEQNRLLQLNSIQQPVDPRQALLATVNAPVTNDIAGALIQGKQRRRALDTLNQLNEMQNQSDRTGLANTELSMRAQDRTDRNKSAEAESLLNQQKLQLDILDKDRNHALAQNKLELEQNKPTSRTVNEYDPTTGAVIGQSVLTLDPITRKWVKSYSSLDDDISPEEEKAIN